MPKDNLDMDDLVESIKEVATTFEEFKKANDDRLKEIEKKGSADPVLEEKLGKMDKHISEHQNTLDLLNARLKRAAMSDGGRSVSQEELDQKALDWVKLHSKRRGDPITEYGDEQMREYKTAFDRYLRKDERHLSVEESKALSVGKDPDGGYVVYPDMNGRIVTQIFETSPVRQYASTQVIGTDALEGLHDIGEATTGWVGETASRPETDTPELDKWRIPVHELYAKPSATQKLLDDASIDMAGWLAAKVADKMARVENDAFVNGNGVNKPRGFLTYADRSSAGTLEIGKLRRFDSGADGAFVAAPNGGDILIDMIQGLKQPYRAGANFFMNRTTEGGVRKLKDSDGAYLWRPGIERGTPATLLGYPVVNFEDMPDYTTTDALAIAFGDLRQAYQIVDRDGIRVLQDPYSNKPFVEFYTTKRTGGDVIDFDAIVLLEFTA